MFFVIVQGTAQGGASEYRLDELILAEGFRKVVLPVRISNCVRGKSNQRIHTSIWAARHFSRSPTMAWAVRAMTGVEGMPFSRSHSRILAVASNPPCTLSVCSVIGGEHVHLP
jgi:hypothetical protein